ncbi:hypothetical protein ACTHQ6_09980 [Arthrobacter sp. SAFR-179]|uniref:hypothetical protein n=1 Tax=Arthrobacter sp. SAFR-179 TaxID=3387279 RepID=UPI003F7B9B22
MQLIATLVDFEHLDGNRQVGVGELYEDAVSRGLPRQSVTGDLQELQTRGWLWFEPSLAGIQTVTLNQAGVDVAEEFKALRSDPRRRTRQIREDVRSWLYDLYVRGEEASGITDFLTSPANQHFGDPYTEAELDRAAEWLLDEKHIEGILTFSGDLARPTITNKGISIVDNGTPAGDSGRGHITIHNSGAFNWSHNSSNVTQSNNLTQGQVDQVSEMLKTVIPLIASDLVRVSSETVAEAEAVADEIQQEIQSASAQPSRIKELAYKLVELAGTGGVQVGMSAVNSVVQQGIAGM